MEKVRFGVIGIGNMGTSHSGWLVGNRIEGAELTAVCDIDEKRREWAKENLPGTVTVYDDYKKLLDSGKIDAVIIAVPHYLHPEIAIEALKRNIHTMVEKPAWIEMRILPQEEHFTREEMRRVYQGIYIKEMTLFKGETLEYQIYERRESGAVLVKEGRAVCNLKSEGKENSRFACLNQMSEALAQQDADGLLKAMEDYVKKSMVLGILFPVK